MIRLRYNLTRWYSYFTDLGVLNITLTTIWLVYANLISINKALPATLIILLALLTCFPMGFRKPNTLAKFMGIIVIGSTMAYMVMVNIVTFHQRLFIFLSALSLLLWIVEILNLD